ncbi:hypothetical protein GCM10010909_06570 [Acidocella aquatica]|uniref:Uncharacterized protein n=1 Tax=Acidocella aquatica TaxID=1922313 RepID=A0ABQ6A0K6_9PROT|nr:hypothetical protein [Acidocella aquatica]GLR65979.1 hypothetical protein GCM10010909_06570 [Acidocella aquatica]
MSKSFRWSAGDWMGLWMVAILGGGAFAFRLLAIAPRATVGMCAAANAPPICVPRHAVLTLQYYQGFGWAALALGLAAFFLGKRTPAVLALGIGIAAVVNYNATTGIIGAAFGLVTWLSLATGRYAGRA